MTRPAVLRRLHTRTVNPRPGEYPMVYRGNWQRYIAVDGGRFRREIEIPVADTDLAYLRDQINAELDDQEFVVVRRADLADALSTGTGYDNELARGAARGRLRQAINHTTEGAQE